MQVILTKRVAKLGLPGDTVEVAKGYAMNFLFPTQSAIQATKGNLKLQEKLKAEQLAKAEMATENASKIIEAINEKNISIKQKSNEGKLYGSIKEKEIADTILDQLKVSVQEAFIKLNEPIKELGEFEINIEINSEAKAKIKLSVEEE